MPVSIVSLWLPILLAGGLCWLASALIHTLIKYHNADYKELSNEADVSAALAASKPAPAMYTTPYCHDMKAMESDTVQKKFNDGPVAIISVMPNGVPPMGKLLFQQLMFFIVGVFLVACLTSLFVAGGVAYFSVFKTVFLASFLTFGWAQIPHSIWLGQPWSNSLRYLLDALIYASVTAGTFAWLWPN